MSKIIANVLTRVESSSPSFKDFPAFSKFLSEKLGKLGFKLTKQQKRDYFLVFKGPVSSFEKACALFESMGVKWRHIDSMRYIENVEGILVVKGLFKFLCSMGYTKKVVELGLIPPITKSIFE